MNEAAEALAKDDQRAHSRRARESAEASAGEMDDASKLPHTSRKTSPLFGGTTIWLKQAAKLLIRSRVKQRKLEARASGGVSGASTPVAPSTPAANTHAATPPFSRRALTFAGGGITFYLDLDRCCGHGVGGTTDQPWYFLVAGRRRRGIVGGYGLTLAGCRSPRVEEPPTPGGPTAGGLERSGSVRLALVWDDAAGTLAGRQQPSGRPVSFASRSEEGLAKGVVARLKAAGAAANVERDEARVALAGQMGGGDVEALSNRMRRLVEVTNAAAPTGEDEDGEDAQRLLAARARLAVLVAEAVAEGVPGWREKRALLELKPFVLGLAPGSRRGLTDTWQPGAPLETWTDSWGPLKTAPEPPPPAEETWGAPLKPASPKKGRRSPTKPKGSPRVVAASAGEDSKEEEPQGVGSGVARWQEPPAWDPIAVRGRSYLRDKQKYDSPAPFFPLLGLDLFRCPAKKKGGAGPVERVCAHPRSLCQRALRPGGSPLPAAVDPRVAALVKLPPEEAARTGAGGFEPTVLLTPRLEPPAEGSAEAAAASAAEAHGLTAGPIPRDEPVPDQHVLAFNFMLPVGNFVAYFARPHVASGNARDGGSDAHLRALYDAFVRGDDEYRRKRLKMLSRLVDAPWLVKVAVGKGKKPAKLSKHIEMVFSRGRHHLEVTLNVAKSQLGANILKVLLPVTTKVEVDLAFILEGLSDAELPERTLAAVRIVRPDVVHAPLLWSTTADGQPPEDQVPDGSSLSGSLGAATAHGGSNEVGDEAAVAASSMLEKDALRGPGSLDDRSLDAVSLGTLADAPSRERTTPDTLSGHKQASPLLPLPEDPATLPAAASTAFTASVSASVSAAAAAAAASAATVVVELDLANAGVALEASELAALLRRLPHLTLLRLADNERVCGGLGCLAREGDSPHRASPRRKKSSKKSFGLIGVGGSWSGTPRHGTPKSAKRQPSGSSLGHQHSNSALRLTRHGTGQTVVSFREPEAEARQWRVLLRAFYEKAEKEGDRETAVEAEAVMSGLLESPADFSAGQSTRGEGRGLAAAAGQSLHARLAAAEPFAPVPSAAADDDDDDGCFLRGMPLSGVGSYEAAALQSSSSGGGTAVQVYFLFFAPLYAASERACVLKVGATDARTRAELFAHALAASVGAGVPPTTLVTREGATGAAWRALGVEAAGAAGDAAAQLTALLQGGGGGPGAALLTELVPGEPLEGGLGVGVAQDLGAVFLLDLLVCNGDRLPCAALGWRGHPGNLLVSAAGRLAAVDTTVPRAPPTDAAKKSDPETYAAVVARALGEASARPLVAELYGRPADQAAADAFREGFRGAAARLAGLAAALADALDALRKAFAGCSNGAAALLLAAQSAPSPSPAFGVPRLSASGSAPPARAPTPPEASLDTAKDASKEASRASSRRSSKSSSASANRQTAPSPAHARPASRAAAKSKGSKGGKGAADESKASVQDVRAVHARYMEGSATRRECDFVDTWRDKFAALGRCLDAALAQCADAPVSNGFLDFSPPPPGLLGAAAAFELLARLKHLVPRAQLLRQAALLERARAEEALPPPDVPLRLRQASPLRAASAQRPPSRRLVSRARTSTSPSERRRLAPKRAPAAFQEAGDADTELDLLSLSFSL